MSDWRWKQSWQFCLISGKLNFHSQDSSKKKFWIVDHSGFRKHKQLHDAFDIPHLLNLWNSSDLPCLQNTPANIPHIYRNLQNISLEIHLRQQTQTVLMVSCRQRLPISSRVWNFHPLFLHHAVFMHLLRQPAPPEPLSHIWLLSQLRSDGVATECFYERWEARFFLGGGWLCLAPSDKHRKRLIIQKWKSPEVNRVVGQHYSIGFCSSFTALHCKQEVTWRRRGEGMEAVMEGLFAPPSSKIWISHSSDLPNRFPPKPNMQVYLLYWYNETTNTVST